MFGPLKKPAIFSPEKKNCLINSLNRNEATVCSTASGPDAQPALGQAELRWFSANKIGVSFYSHAGFCDGLEAPDIIHMHILVDSSAPRPSRALY